MSQFPPSEPSYDPMFTPGPKPVPPASRGNGPAVASLVCGLIGCVPFVGLLFGLIGFILGIVGLRKSRDPYVGGKGMAIAGLVLGLIGTVVWGGAVVGVVALAPRIQSMVKVPEEFTRDLSEGNINAARTRCVASMDKDRLVAASKAMKEWGPFKSMQMLSFGNNTPGQQRMNYLGTATFEKAMKQVRITMEPEGGPLDFKISDFKYE